MTDLVQVLVTCPSEENATTIAHVLIHNRLAACVQILGPIKSFFRWNGKVDEVLEWQCVIKTRRACFLPLQKLVLENHPYEIPELIAVPIVEGSEAYLAWVRGEVIYSSVDM